MDMNQPGDVVGLCYVHGDLSILIVTPSFLDWRGTVEAVEFVFNPGFTATPSPPN
ncbi:hypothetical protein HY523_01760 [Candidatus Berkelbacteria bacterium]|nr:hypothetical protein [Candidatus Berkelbacteria bacterium]